ncbi:MAG: glycosyltransferase family 4 protein [Candidatus Binataceae bacterium]
MRHPQAESRGCAANSQRAASTAPLSRAQVRIGIDAGQLAHPHTGIGRYTLELCRALDSLLPNAQFFVYSRDPVDAPVESSRWTVRVERVAASRRLHDWLWMTFRCSAMCAKDDLNIFWAARTLAPSLRASTKCVVTVYDLFHLDRQLVSLKRWLFYRWFVDRALRRADVIVTISNDAASELRRLRGYESDAVVRPAVSSNFRPRDESEIQSCLRQYNLARPYLLNISRWDPKKNLTALLQAFLGMKRKGLIPKYALALVGGPDGNDKGNDHLRRLVREGKSSGVALVGPVREEHLAALYSGCEAFVFPSSHEGFGIPVLEARACGARIVAADSKALREAGGIDAVYVTPTVKGIRHGILVALSSHALPAQKRGLWTWAESGEVFVKALIAT